MELLQLSDNELRHELLKTNQQYLQAVIDVAVEDQEFLAHIRNHLCDLLGELLRRKKKTDIEKNTEFKTNLMNVKDFSDIPTWVLQEKFSFESEFIINRLLNVPQLGTLSLNILFSHLKMINAELEKRKDRS